MGDESCLLVAIKRMIEDLVAKSKDFDDSQKLATERAVRRIYPLIAEDLEVKQDQLDWEWFHPAILDVIGRTRLLALTLDTLSWLLHICYSPNSFISSENLDQTDGVAKRAIDDFKALYDELGLNVPEGLS